MSRLNDFFAQFEDNEDNEGNDSNERTDSQEKQNVQARSDRMVEVEPVPKKEPVHKAKSIPETNVRMSKPEQPGSERGVNRNVKRIVLKPRKEQTEQKVERQAQRNEEREIQQNVSKQSVQSNIEPEASLEEAKAMFELSGTPEVFREKWIALWQKAIKSDKRTIINDKVKRGKFRYTMEGTLEVLPDMDTHGKTSKDILMMDGWQI